MDSPRTVATTKKDGRIKRPTPPVRVSFMPPPKPMPRPNSIQVRSATVRSMKVQSMVVQSAPRPKQAIVHPSPRPKPWLPVNYFQPNKKQDIPKEITPKKKNTNQTPKSPKQKKQEEEEKKAAAELVVQRESAAKEQQQAQKRVVQAKQKAMEARLKRWKQQQQQEQEKNRKNKNKKNKTPQVERVPKLSALLATGGPEAQEYAQQIALARLATWNSNVGDKWQIVRHTFEGRSISETTQKEAVQDRPLLEALETFRKDPDKYLAFYFCPKQPNQFTYILRAGTVGYEPQDLKTDGTGKFLILRHLYQRLPPLQDNLVPAKFRDKYTDHFEFGGQKLHSNNNNNKPLLPGRGMGLGDEANMELIGELGPQPDHVRQGACVGDCWLLSAIACLADFDFAVERLFRKNTQPSIQELPQDPPNQYTVTLWDLTTWKEVDVVIDERLPVRADGSGFLLGSKPSRDGKFWVPYLEKAIAAHCGGYDKINGGNCTDAWPMLTGSRNQFLISKNEKTGKYKCGAKYNPQEQKWSKHSNSPHDSNPSIWQVEWPKVGGGGDSTLELNQNELFQRIVVWDEHNYLIGAATSGTSDKSTTDGLVDNHAYSVIDSRQDICKTGIDLLLIRNPWGHGGELENGQFMRSGPGWKRYPDIKMELNPTTEDNGLCWVTKSEFFRYFPTIYVCALNMTRLKDDNYVNDLKDDFKRGAKEVPKKAAPKAKEDARRPIRLNTTSDPSSGYKIVEDTFGGGVKFFSLNKDVIKGRSIVKGVAEFRANPDKYLAIHYQKNMVSEGWPVKMHQYTYIYRQGTKGLELDKNRNGNRTILMNVPR